MIDREHTLSVTRQAVCWYNTSRPHSSLSDTTPEQAYLDWLPKLAEAA